MREASICPVLVLVLLLFSAPPASAASTASEGPVSRAVTSLAENPALVAGTYRGIIWSEKDVEATTIIAEDGDGGLAGEYSFPDKSGVATGTLSDFAATSDDTLKCKWHDRFGWGWLEMTFNSERTAFEGTWWSQGGRKHRWGGTRQ